VIFKRVNCINKIVHRVSLTSLLDVSKRMHHTGGPLCPTLRGGWLASLLLGESKRRLKAREISLDYVAAA
jgi:hypothetical protein